MNWIGIFWACLKVLLDVAQIFIWARLFKASLTSSLRVISLTVLVDSIHNILIFFAEKMWVHSYSHFFSKIFQRNWVSLDVNFNESLTNDIVSFEQLGPGYSTLQPGSTTEYLVQVSPPEPFPEKFLTAECHRPPLAPPFWLCYYPHWIHQYR